MIDHIFLHKSLVKQISYIHFASIFCVYNIYPSQHWLLVIPGLYPASICKVNPTPSCVSSVAA